VSKFAKGTEPYDVRLLTRWLVDTYRPTLLPGADAIFHAYELPSGNTVVIPGPSAAHRPVSTGTARKVATDAGLTFEEFREAIGHPLIKHTRPSRKTVKHTVQGCSKTEVVRLSAEVRSTLARLEGALKQGAPRDSAFYLRLHKQLSTALVATESAITETTRIGALHA